jgi:hypothetical protein
MSANTETYHASIASASTTKKATLDAAVGTAITTINVGGVDAGYRLGFPTNAATYTAAVASANAALIASRASAEQTRQASVNAAKETLRGQGEIP